MTDTTRFEMRLTPAMREKLAAAAAASVLPPAAMARVLLARALDEPLNGAEKATFGHDAVRSPVSDRIYEQGAGSYPPEVQDRLALAEVRLGRRLSQAEAQLLIRDPVGSAAAAAAASIEGALKP